ncbi:MAG: RDD family protein [Flavobacteriales bacterium]|jgi:uncharacterized RDD family membrane protein YckC|nr:RDD family protein [Flavobacteriales bacterium]
MTLIQTINSQNIQLNLRIANVGKRIGAFLIDLVIKVAYVIAIINVIDFSNVMDIVDHDPWSRQTLFLLFFAPVTFYTLILENIFKGRTIGKILVKTRVVKPNGAPAGFLEYFIRWIFNLVDIFTFYGFIGVFTAAVSKKNQRIGDILADTIVLDVKKEFDINQTFYTETQASHQITFPQVTMLSDKDMQHVKNIFSRAQKHNDYPTMKKLRAKLDSIIQTESRLNDQQYIKTVLQDYNHLTKEFRF